MTYGVPWAEFSAALALVDQENKVEVSRTDCTVILRTPTDTLSALKYLLHSFKIRRYKTGPTVDPRVVVVFIQSYRFDDLPEG